MNVLMVGRGAPERGGIAAFLESMAEGPMADLVDVEVLNLTRSEEEPQGGALTWPNVRRTGQDMWRVVRAGRRNDVVHLHSSLAPAVTMVRAGLLVLAARLAGRPVVVHAHGGLAITWLRGRRARSVTRLALGAAARVVAVADPVREAFAEVLGPAKVVHVPNGVDLRRFRPAGSTAATGQRPGIPRLLYVGLLSPRKGVGDLLEASALLRSRGVEHELVLVGGTPDEGPSSAVAITAAADAAGATRLGTVPHREMPSAYTSADVFCLPSWWEAMPLTVLEAMASGLPVVATDVGAVPAMICGPDHGGILVPARAPKELADALQPLLVNDDLRRRMGLLARERAESFSEDTTASLLAGIYEEITR